MIVSQSPLSGSEFFPRLDGAWTLPTPVSILFVGSEFFGMTQRSFCGAKWWSHPFSSGRILLSQADATLPDSERLNPLSVGVGILSCHFARKTHSIRSRSQSLFVGSEFFRGQRISGRGMSYTSQSFSSGRILSEMEILAVEPDDKESLNPLFVGRNSFSFFLRPFLKALLGLNPLFVGSNSFHIDAPIPT